MSALHATGGAESSTKKPGTVLFVANFAADVGYAWKFIEGLYASAAGMLARDGVRSFVAYPSVNGTPAALEGSAATAVQIRTDLRTYRSLREMLALIRRERVKVVYLTDRDAVSPVYLLLRLFGARRIILHDHTSGDRTRPRGLKRMAKWLWVRIPGMSVDRVLTVSDFVRERVVSTTLIPARKVRRIWNGIDAQTPDPLAREAVLTELALPRTTSVVLYCGRITQEKGAHILMQAFDALLRDQPELDAVLVVVGHGPQFGELRSLRSAMGTQERIFLLGHRPSAFKYQNAASIVVVPSLWQEALGLAALEPQSLGKAVIASRVGGIPELVQDGETGILVPPGDTGKLALAMRDLLRDPAQASAMGRAARDRARTLFSLDAQIDAITREILEDRRL